LFCLKQCRVLMQMVNKAGEQLDPSERYEATKKRLKD